MLHRTMHLGFTELLIVLMVLLLIFGPGKIPQLGDAIGKGIRNFKKAARTEDDSIDVTPKNLGSSNNIGSPQSTAQTTPASTEVKKP